MKSKEVKVVIPIYHKQLTYNEKISLLQCKRILNQHSLCLIKPINMSLQIEEIQGIEIEEFDRKWFQSVQTYNLLMLTEQFYERFEDYEYILIYQLDAFVFRDELLTFCSMGYDYIGAPWLHGKFVYVNGAGGYYYIGNGGFSLRKVKSHLDILKKSSINGIVNEDMFFASRQHAQFRIAPIEVATGFAFETNVRECIEKNNGKLPFGCHAWEKYDFQFYQNIFQDFGYDTSDIQDGKLDQIKDDALYDLAELTEKELRETLKFIFPNMENEIWIWGAGQIGKECGWQMLRNHIHIKGFLDKNMRLHGTKLFEKEIVIAPCHYFKDTGKTPLIIAMSQIPEEIIEQLNQNSKYEGRDYISWNMLCSLLKVY